ncbi:MAG: FAD-dependent protein [Rectinemataceae bacterium]
MGYAEYEVRIPAGEGDEELRAAVAKITGLREFSVAILGKSLDARRKSRIEWQYRVGITADGIPGGAAPIPNTLAHDSVGRGARVVVIGSGPAGIFAAAYLVRSGFRVAVLERGSRVEERRAAIREFESGGAFPKKNNYPFGEGGAGTFSDGKLSSRTKNIGPERNYIFSDFIAAGAPQEISHMTHPHLGSDKLFAMTRRMRDSLSALGVEFRFDTMAVDVSTRGDRVDAVITADGPVDADYLVFACGHSAMETYRMLIERGVPFRAKNFAIGFRTEHEQTLINRAQWGVDALPGVKAAEYRLTARASDGTGLYSFCMCPGGTIVPAAAYEGTNVVNGKSDYARAGRWANAAVVAELNLESLLARELRADEALDWLEALERSYFSFAGGYRSPAMTVENFLSGKPGGGLLPSSYPLGLAPADFRDLLPAGLVTPLREGLRSFCGKLRGYETGQLLGLESKTSAPIQALRHPELLYSRYENLYVAGEGSGWSGGIVSSAADGLKVAQALCRAAVRDSGTIGAPS